MACAMGWAGRALRRLAVAFGLLVGALAVLAALIGVQIAVGAD
jgi:hypothetical protein